MRLLPTIAALSLGLAGAAHAEPMAGDGPGCKDKTVAAGLIGLTDTDPAYIAIWAEGMQDQSCRGYGRGQEVTVEAREDGLVCVRAEDDETCFWALEKIAPQ